MTATATQTTQTEAIQTAISKGTSMLIVNLVDSGSEDAANNIINMAKDKDIPVVFFNRAVSTAETAGESVISSYDKCAFIGTDYEMAGHMQGQMIGDYLVANYDKLDLNGDGKISYVMFKGDEANAEAIARTQYGVEDADKVLTDAGKSALEFYDSANSNKYLVDQNGTWSAQAATEYMQTILSQYSEANNNMVELSSPTMTTWLWALSLPCRTPATTRKALLTSPSSALTQPTLQRRRLLTAP